MNFWTGLTVMAAGGALAVSGVEHGAVKNLARVVIGALLMFAGSIIVIITEEGSN